MPRDHPAGREAQGKAWGSVGSSGAPPPSTLLPPQTACSPTWKPSKHGPLGVVWKLRSPGTTVSRRPRVTDSAASPSPGQAEKGGRTEVPALSSQGRLPCLPCPPAPQPSPSFWAGEKPPRNVTKDTSLQQLGNCKSFSDSVTQTWGQRPNLYSYYESRHLKHTNPSNCITDFLGLEGIFEMIPCPTSWVSR